MKRMITGLLAAVLTAVSVPVQAEEQPFAETAEVFQYVLDNHLSKPTAKQLVQGALSHVSEEAGRQAHLTLKPSADDDTLPEMEQRLAEWQRAARLDETALNRWAIDGMLATLDDPHTMFFTRDDLQMFEAGVENQFVGFGFRLRMQDGLLVIRDIVPQSPAAASELRKGDQLLTVDGKSLKGKSFEEAFAMLRGEENSEAVLTIYRPSEKREKQVRLKRAAVTMPEVEGDLFEGGAIGYVSLATFGSEAAVQLRDKLDQLSRIRPLKGLILDLRDNSGGYLSTARDVASLFMEEGLLMYTTNRNGVEVETWVRNGRDVGYPVRILVNEGTASASELVAGALRDHGIAVLVGTKTYGKGSAQQIIPLSNGDALKLTLHEYFTPKHTVVNHVGLEPDLAVEDYAAQVVEALRSLDVQAYRLTEENGDTVINGIAFPTVDPLFKRENGQWLVRAAVLSRLLGDSAVGKQDYVPIAPYLQRYKTLVLQQNNDQPVLVYTAAKPAASR